MIEPQSSKAIAIMETSALLLLGTIRAKIDTPRAKVKFR